MCCKALAGAWSNAQLLSLSSQPIQPAWLALQKMHGSRSTSAAALLRHPPSEPGFRHVASAIGHGRREGSLQLPPGSSSSMTIPPFARPPVRL